MADPFSIASGAAGIVSMGFSIAHGLFQIAQKIGSAGDEVRVYAEEIDTFSKLLGHIKAEIERSTDISVAIQSLIKDVMDICGRVLVPLDRLQANLKPLLARFSSSTGKFRQLGLRLQWVFREKAKLLFFREALRAHHRNLDTALAVIILQTTRDRSRPDIYVTQLSLENSISAMRVCHIENYRADSRTQLENLPSERATTAAGAVQPAGDGTPGGSDDGQQGSDESLRMSQVALVRVSAASRSSDDQLSEQELADIDGQIERDLASEEPQAELYLWIDTGALQRRLLKLASEALQTSREALAAAVPGSRPPPERPEDEMLVLFVCSPKINHGPVAESEVFYIDGTDASLAATGATVTDRVAAQAQLLCQGIYITREYSTGPLLLNELQTMERESATWVASQCRGKYHDALSPMRDEWLTRTVAVGLQKNRQKWNGGANADGERPYAMTSMCHIMEIAAMLGLHWEEFDRNQNKYRAKGNGYMLTAQAARTDFRIVFKFQAFGTHSFAQRRIIPTEEVKELCFGVVPTVFRILNHGLPGGIETLQLGSLEEIAETLQSLGCLPGTSEAFLKNWPNSFNHLYPAIFDLVGMLGRLVHRKDTLFTFLPNPTIFRWDKYSFSLRRLLSEFATALEHADTRYLNRAVMDALHRLDSILPQQESGFNQLQLNELHDAISLADSFLFDGTKSQEVLEVVRNHMREVHMFVSVGTVGTSDWWKAVKGYRSSITKESVLIDCYLNMGLKISRLEFAPDLQQWSEKMLIWAMLVFRMLCWLLLHDFKKADVQPGSKSELIGQSLPVYIV